MYLVKHGSLVNGSLGMIVDWVVPQSNTSPYPVHPVFHSEHDGRRIVITPLICCDDEHEDDIFVCLPLIIAEALSIHKSMGATLPCVIVDCGEPVEGGERRRGMFAPNQLRVAVSRVPSAHCLAVKHYQRGNDVKVCKDSHTWMDRLERHSRMQATAVNSFLASLGCLGNAPSSGSGGPTPISAESTNEGSCRRKTSLRPSVAAQPVGKGEDEGGGSVHNEGTQSCHEHSAPSPTTDEIWTRGTMDLTTILDQLLPYDLRIHVVTNLGDADGSVNQILSEIREKRLTGRTLFILNNTEGTELLQAGWGIHWSALLAEESRLCYFEPAANEGMRKRNLPLAKLLRFMLTTTEGILFDNAIPTGESDINEATWKNYCVSKQTDTLGCGPALLQSLISLLGRAPPQSSAALSDGPRAGLVELAAASDADSGVLAPAVARSDDYQARGQGPGIDGDKVSVQDYGNGEGSDTGEGVDDGKGKGSAAEEAAAKAAEEAAAVEAAKALLNILPPSAKAAKEGGTIFYLDSMGGKKVCERAAHPHRHTASAPHTEPCAANHHCRHASPHFHTYRAPHRHTSLLCTRRRTSSQDVALDLLKKYLHMEWVTQDERAALDDDEQLSLFQGMKHRSIKDLPQQANHYDCGLFMLRYIEKWLSVMPHDLVADPKPQWTKKAQLCFHAADIKKYRIDMRERISGLAAKADLKAAATKEAAAAKDSAPPQSSGGGSSHRNSSGGGSLPNRSSSRLAISGKEPSERVLVYPSISARDAVTLKVGDVKRLYSAEFLNDSLVDFEVKWMQRKLADSGLQANLDKCHIFNSFFYQKLLREMHKTGVQQQRNGYKKIKRWSGIVNLFEKEYVLVPMCEALHWTLAIICHPKKVAEEEAVRRRLRKEEEKAAERAATAEVGEPINVDEERTPPGGSGDGEVADEGGSADADSEMHSYVHKQSGAGDESPAAVDSRVGAPPQSTAALSNGPRAGLAELAAATDVDGGVLAPAAARSDDYQARGQKRVHWGELPPKHVKLPRTSQLPLPTTQPPQPPQPPQQPQKQKGKRVHWGDLQPKRDKLQRNCAYRWDDPVVDAGRGEGLSLENILSPKSTDMPAIQMSSRARRIIACAAEASNVALADAQQSRLQSGEQVDVQRAPALAGARGGAAQVTETEDGEEDEGDEEEAVAAEAAASEAAANKVAPAQATETEDGEDVEDVEDDEDGEDGEDDENGEDDEGDEEEAVAAEAAVAEAAANKVAPAQATETEDGEDVEDVEDDEDGEDDDTMTAITIQGPLLAWFLLDPTGACARAEEAGYPHIRKLAEFRSRPIKRGRIAPLAVGGNKNMQGENTPQADVIAEATRILVSLGECVPSEAELIAKGWQNSLVGMLYFTGSAVKNTREWAKLGRWTGSIGKWTTANLIDPVRSHTFASPLTDWWAKKPCGQWTRIKKGVMKQIRAADRAAAAEAASRQAAAAEAASSAALKEAASKEAASEEAAFEAAATSRARRIIACAAEASNVALADAQQSRLQSGERVDVQRAPALRAPASGAAQVTETEDDEGDEEEAVAAEAAAAEPPAAEAAAAEAAAAEEDAERDMSAEAIDMLAEEKFGYEQRIARADLRKEIILFTQQQEVWN